jgi:plastocyanin
MSDDRADVGRRRLLRTAGTALAAAVGAGCLSNPWEPGAESDGSGEAPTPDSGGPGGATTAAGTTGDAAATGTPVPPEQKEPDQIVEVAPDGFMFAPETFEVAVGDTVHWVWRDSGHNVRVRSKPDGSDWTGTPGGETDTFSEGYLHAHTFSVAGEYECYCAPHQSLGLEGSFQVR